jgi:hypothetical protein
MNAAFLTPKALANFSSGLERKRQPWVNITTNLNPERVRLKTNAFSVSIFYFANPGVVAALQPQAEISERLRRYEHRAKK